MLKLAQFKEHKISHFDWYEPYLMVCTDRAFIITRDMEDPNYMIFNEDYQKLCHIGYESTDKTFRFFYCAKKHPTATNPSFIKIYDEVFYMTGLIKTKNKNSVDALKYHKNHLFVIFDTHTEIWNTINNNFVWTIWGIFIPSYISNDDEWCFVKNNAKQLVFFNKNTKTINDDKTIYLPHVFYIYNFIFLNENLAVIAENDDVQQTLKIIDISQQGKCVKVLYTASPYAPYMNFQCQYPFVIYYINKQWHLYNIKTYIRTILPVNSTQFHKNKNVILEKDYALIDNDNDHIYKYYLYPQLIRCLLLIFELCHNCEAETQLFLAIRRYYYYFMMN